MVLVDRKRTGTEVVKGNEPNEFGLCLLLFWCGVRGGRLECSTSVFSCFLSLFLSVLYFYRTRAFCVFDLVTNVRLDLTLEWIKVQAAN